jgi:hypothetical protein
MLLGVYCTTFLRLLVLLLLLLLLLVQYLRHIGAYCALQLLLFS